MSKNRARIAELKVCDDDGCDVGHLLVRGDRISFLSVEADEKYRRMGYTRKVEDGMVYWDPEMPDSDVELEEDFVLVQDTTGQLLTRCDFYALRSRNKSAQVDTSVIDAEALGDAREYFVSESGREITISHVSVEFPEGSWKSEARVKYIRYRRPGFAKPFEHPYDPDVELFVCERPLAWRLALPSGCVVDSRGFVWP